MAWQTSVLVVANRTAGSDELIAALEQRARRGPTTFTLLMPCTPGARVESRARLDEAVERMRAAGLDVNGVVGDDPDPLASLTEVWDPAAYDEIVVATFRSGASHWLNLDLPQRVRKLTDAPVEHVVAGTARATA